MDCYLLGDDMPTPMPQSSPVPASPEKTAAATDIPPTSKRVQSIGKNPIFVL